MTHLLVYFTNLFVCNARLIKRMDINIIKRMDINIIKRMDINIITNVANPRLLLRDENVFNSL